MKKFLLFILISVAVVSLGLTIYYFSSDNEEYIIKHPAGYVVNVGESIDLAQVLEVKNKSEHTSISYSTSNPTTLKYVAETTSFLTQTTGGTVDIIIKTSNRNYSQLSVSVIVRDGSEAYPFIIDSAEQLQSIGTGIYGLDKYYQLNNDIYLANLGENARWTPIGYNTNNSQEGVGYAFTGVFDGNNHAIYNLTIANYVIEEVEVPEGEEAPEATEPGKGYDENYDVANYSAGAGLFYEIGEKGTVRNLTINIANIKGYFEKVGVIASKNSGTIKNVEIGEGSSIVNSKSGSVVGGIVGENNGTIYWASSKSGIYVDNTGTDAGDMIIGGLVGRNYGKIFESYFKGEIKRTGTQTIAGGIVGINDYKNLGTTVATSFIYDCYAVITDVSDSKPATVFGGIIGQNKNFSEDEKNTYGGSYFANLKEGKDFPSKWIGESFTGGMQDALTGATCKVTSQDLTNSQTLVRYSYSNGDNEYWSSNVWVLSNVKNDGHPIINRSNTIMSIYNTEQAAVDLDTASLIANAKQLLDALNLGYGTYIITQDIDFAEFTESYRNYKSTGWKPIALTNQAGLIITSEGVDKNNNGVIEEDEPKFATIKNINIYNETEDAANVGLFTYLAKASISNVKFENITISGKKAINVGVIAGSAGDVSLKNVSVENVEVKIANSLIANFGALFGEYGGNGTSSLSGVSAKNISASATTLFANAGGLVGVLKENGKLSSEKNVTGTVISKNSVDGVNLIAKVFGGVAGRNYGIIDACEILNINVEINYSNAASLYSTTIFFNDKIESENPNDTHKNFAIGGVAGYNAGTIQHAFVKDNNTIKFYRTVLSEGVASAAGYIGGIAGINKSNISYARFAGKIEVAFNSTYPSEMSKAALIGGIVGRAMAGTINFAEFIGEISAPNTKAGASYVGGLIGKTDALSTVKVKLSVVNGKLYGYYVGVFAGAINSKSSMERVEAKANNVSAKGTYVGGFACTLVKEAVEAGGENSVFTNSYSKYTIDSEGNSNESAYAAGFVLKFATENNGVLTDVSDNYVFNKVAFTSCIAEISYTGSAAKKYALTSWAGDFKFMLIGIKLDRDYNALFSNCKYFDTKGLEYTEAATKTSYKKGGYNTKDFANFDSSVWQIVSDNIYLISVRYEIDRI